MLCRNGSSCVLLCSAARGYAWGILTSGVCQPPSQTIPCTQLAVSNIVLLELLLVSNRDALELK
eukprot:scaffold14845_cov115-Skeletonema_dohrnii-CCMP3373.AAC.3